MRLSPSVPSSSPVVAAVGLALAASVWLAAVGPCPARAPLEPTPTNPISLSAPGGEEDETNNYNPPTRTTRTRLRLVSTCANTSPSRQVTSATPPVAEWTTRRTTPLVGLAPSGQSQFARSPNRFTLTTTKRAPSNSPSLSNAGRRARMLSLVPAGAQPSDRRGCRMSWLHFNLSSNSTSLGRRCGHRAAFTGYRTSLSAALSLPGARD